VESFLESEQMLIDIIKTHAIAAAQAGDWSAVAATLNAQTVEVRNDKSWTMADLITLLGAESAAVIGGTIQAAGATNPIFAGAWLALNITGLQLHTDERQAMIAGLADAAGWTAELKAAALAAGLTHTSLAGETVTAEDCESAWNTDLAQIARAARRALYDAFENAIGTSEQAEKIAEMRTMLESVEAI
jgi:3-deoxy-D-manno-octulosonic-acid transferase